eukprot:g1256.t1
MADEPLLANEEGGPVTYEDDDGSIMKAKDAATMHDANKSWCARHPKCRCCSICGATTGLILLIFAAVFWPRLLLVCVEYANPGLRASVTQQALSATSPVEVRLAVPIKTNNRNLWSISVPKVRVESYYAKNRDAFLGAGEVEDLSLVALGLGGESEFTVDLVPPQVTTAQLATAARLYDTNNGECRPAVCSAVAGVGTQCNWPMDLKIMINILGYPIEFWVRNLKMPCPSVGAGATLAPLPVQDDNNDAAKSCASKDEAHKGGGHNCVAFFCSISDIMCENEECMKNQKARTPVDQGQEATTTKATSSVEL